MKIPHQLHVMTCQDSGEAKHGYILRDKPFSWAARAFALALKMHAMEANANTKVLLPIAAMLTCNHHSPVPTRVKFRQLVANAIHMRILHSGGRLSASNWEFLDFLSFTTTWSPNPTASMVFPTVEASSGGLAV